VWEGNGVSVSGVLEGDPDFYAIEFRPWDEWLGMGIRDEDLQEIGHLSMLCHCLYELTFVGFSNEEVGTKWRELKSMNDELDKQLESGEFVFEDVDTFLDALDGE
jgi:hypothetical protein